MIITVVKKKTGHLPIGRYLLHCVVDVGESRLGIHRPPGGSENYHSSKAQTKDRFVCSQLESMTTGKGLARFLSSLPMDVAFPFPFPFAPFADRWGPEG